MRALFELFFGGFDAMLGAVPLAAARWVTVGYFLFVAAASLLLPREFVFRGAPDQRWYRDLRWWALAATLPYVLIYALV
jgi:hypothetical protein